jgi:hypothetical protein
LAGLVIGIDPFFPATSQLPIMSAAEAGIEKWAIAASAATARKLLLVNSMVFLQSVFVFP